MRRNISERVQSLAPFLVYDNDPYIVVGEDGRLTWMIDAYTSSANYPYSRHYVYDRSGVQTNYFRNSVKVTIDAYTGAVNFTSSIGKTRSSILTARRFLPFSRRARNARRLARARSLSRNFDTHAGRSLQFVPHAKRESFFQREDVWSVARQINLTADKRQEAEPLDPYFVLMQLPGEKLPPTSSSRYFPSRRRTATT
jgi:uncharacterized membrane protein (UPF0182 family)